MKNITLKPRLSEKAYDLSQNNHVYAFVVPNTATKQSIAAAVTSQFGVTVEAVNISVSKGKVVRSYRKRTRGVAGTRKDIKKAYVTVKKGDSIAIFDTPEDQKNDSKADKKAKKDKETK